MAEMKSNQHEERNGQAAEEEVRQEVDFVRENSNSPREESGSDGSSNHGSVGGVSMDEDPIVTPQAVAAAAQAQNIKKTLSKQPSNGIHVLKPEGLSQTANGLPPFPNPDSAQNGEATNKHSKEEDITFDPNGSYYMANACCELLHYRTAAVVVGIVEIAMIIVWGVLMAYFYKVLGGVDSAGSKASVGLQAVFAAAFLAIIILMLIGVKTERPVLLWPHMILQIFGIVLGIALTVVAVIAMCAGTSLAEAIFSFICGAHNLPKVEAALGPIWPFCLAVIFDFGAALGIWFYIVIKGCYEYLMDKIFFEKEFNNGHNVSLKKDTSNSTSKKAS